MTITLIVLATLLGLVATVSASGKLRRMPQVVETMGSVGVTQTQIPLLAVAELLGAVGLLVGIWIPLIGTLAAAGLSVYFLGAVVAHLRVKDAVKDLSPALVLAILAIVVFILQLGR